MATWSLYSEILEDAMVKHAPDFRPDAVELARTVVERRERLSLLNATNADLMERITAEVEYDLALIDLSVAYGFRPDPRDFSNPSRSNTEVPCRGRRQLESFVGELDMLDVL
ncbi:MAG: hypothetical protein M1134_01560 [Actinobacteria bacterium]|jgi:hypothetical protein|nr:hypothetical protein [Actinomycetota bacterium]MCL5444918.1 hypothetical protein [Actinomycetota bacterium]